MYDNSCMFQVRSPRNVPEPPSHLAALFRPFMQRVSFKMIESVSRRAFSGASGTYNVRASELACNHRHKTLSSTVIFLDDSEHTFQIEKRAKGKCLLELVFQHLELVEKDYFGLQYTENELPPSPSNTDSTVNIYNFI